MTSIANLVARLIELPPRSLFAIGFVSFAVYLFALAISRLYLSPIAKFPGPKVAALTKWYEFYYEVVLRGSYSDHIAGLHKIYGPIVRVTPTELHVKDPAFYETLFNKNPKSIKDPWFNARFGNATSVFSTCDAAHHQLRRSALNPYFSKRAIDQCEDIVQSKIEIACSRFPDYNAQDNPLNLTRVWDAYSSDVIMQYSFGFSYDNLKSEDFCETFHDAFLALSEFGSLGCQFPIMGPIMESLPDWLTRAMNPPLGRVLTLLKDLSRRVDQAKSDNRQGKEPQQQTVFHAMLKHDLPPEEFEARRMRDEAQTVVGAGLTTTAWSISNACYYLAENPEAQARLHKELVDAIPDLQAAEAFNLRKLESLPYLRGCVKEGVRLSVGVSGRNNRIWKTDLPYGDWVIPAGTTVSMNHQDILNDPQIFPDPTEIKPERWAGHPKAPDGSSLERYFVPFGKGDRQCLGINLAMMEICLALAHVFRKFRLELYETDRSDVLFKHDFFIPSPKLTSKGVRVKVAEVYDR